MDYKLTSVKILKELYKKFKDKIQSYDKLIPSGSRL